MSILTSSSEDIAFGLELSSARFIWVIRFLEGKKTSAAQVLPSGFLERIGERGMVIEKWPYNARLVEAIKVGVDVGRDADGRFKREEIAIMVRNMVVGGGHMREKVKELGEIVRKQGDEDLCMAVINSLVKLCEPKN
ncbi:hypothetical protein Tco_0775350 [Tanacetum coccineum]